MWSPSPRLARRESARQALAARPGRQGAAHSRECLAGAGLHGQVAEEPLLRSQGRCGRARAGRVVNPPRESRECAATHAHSTPARAGPRGAAPSQPGHGRAPAVVCMTPPRRLAFITKPVRDNEASSAMSCSLSGRRAAGSLFLAMTLPSLELTPLTSVDALTRRAPMLARHPQTSITRRRCCRCRRRAARVARAAVRALPRRTRNRRA